MKTECVVPIIKNTNPYFNQFPIEDDSFISQVSLKYFWIPTTPFTDFVYFPRKEKHLRGIDTKGKVFLTQKQAAGYITECGCRDFPIYPDIYVLVTVGLIVGIENTAVWLNENVVVEYGDIQEIEKIMSKGK